MKFSTQEEYGLRCLLQIARTRKPGGLTIPEISRAEALSQTHVAKLLMVLRKEGFVQATRGQAGGYTLARDAESISVGEILAALGGKLYDGEFCERHSGQLDICKHAVDCSVRSLWQIIQKSVDEVVDRISLADLLESSEKSSNVTFSDRAPRPALTSNLP
jgi:Rrf2 family protein